MLIARTTTADRAILKKLYYELFFWGTLLSSFREKILIFSSTFEKPPPRNNAFWPFSALGTTTDEFLT